MNRYFNYYKYGTTCVLEIMNDDLNIFNAPEANTEFKNTLDSTGMSDIIVDLKNITRIDSVGIGFLISIKNISVKQQCDIVLVCSNDLVGKVLKITRMENFFTIFKDLDDAVLWINNKEIG